MSLRKMDREEDLTEAWNTGDELAFSVIYDVYWDRLLANAYRLTGDKEQSEEIVQEVFVSLWRRRHDVHIESISSYLGTAVKFATFKSLQRAKRNQELEEQFFSTDHVHLDEQSIDAKFLKEYLDGIVEHLPDRCRLVFRMSREEQKTNKEISGELAISEKAVEAQITKALKVLKLSLRKVGLALSLILFF